MMSGILIIAILILILTITIILIIIIIIITIINLDLAPSYHVFKMYKAVHSSSDSQKSNHHLAQQRFTQSKFQLLRLMIHTT